MEEVIVLGVSKDKGSEGLHYFAASTSNGPLILWLLEGCKGALFKSNELTNIVEEDE